MLTKENILKRLEDESRTIRSYGVRSISLFGSFAQGDASDTSDIDFLVDFEEGRGDYNDYMGLLIFLQDMFKADIDLVKRNLVREELKEEIQKGVHHAAKI